MWIQDGRAPRGIFRPRRTQSHTTSPSQAAPSPGPVLRDQHSNPSSNQPGSSSLTRVTWLKFY